MGGRALFEWLGRMSVQAAPVKIAMMMIAFIITLGEIM